MSPDKMSRTQCRGQNIMRTKCYWSKCQDILSTTFFRQHIFNGILSNDILSIYHFVRNILSGDIQSGHPCRYTAVVQPARQIGVRPISISEIQAMIACKNCVCLVGLRSVGYKWIAGGWIYSKPVGWLVCSLVSVVWSDLWSVVGLPAGLFAIQSVGWLSLPAGLLYPTYHRLTINPSI